MKKLMTLMLGLTIGMGSVALFAQDAPKTEDKKMETKKKPAKKKAPKKTDETKKEGTR